VIKATWRKSTICYSGDLRETVRSLGFRKLNQTRELPETDAVRGMLRKVSFLVSVEGVPWKPPKRARYKIWTKRSAKKHSRGK